MNEAEQFDRWVRAEVESLDDAPVDFQEAALWQKMQAELYAPVIGRTNQTFYRKNRWAAAVALLILATGLWWQWPKAEKTALVEIKVEQPKTTQTTRLVAIAKPTPPRRGTFPRRGLARQPLPRQLANSMPIPDHQQLFSEPQKVEVIEIQPIVETKALPTIEIAQKVEMPKTKPKFKIVHANELEGFERAELAEAREKEAKKQGFIVINWKQKGQEPDNNLMTYLRNKNKIRKSSP